MVRARYLAVATAAMITARQFKSIKATKLCLRTFLVVHCRARLRKFPSLVNCCTIDWFSEWPADALKSVASQFLKVSICLLAVACTAAASLYPAGFPLCRFRLGVP